VLIFSFL